jgi:hypothetical protein
MRHSEHQTPDPDPEIARSALKTYHVNFLSHPELEPDPKLDPDPHCPKMPDPGPHLSNADLRIPNTKSRNPTIFIPQNRFTCILFGTVCENSEKSVIFG